MSDVVDLGVAAPQFSTAPAVAEAILKAAHASSFRYTRPGARYFEAAAAWQRERHGWDVDAADARFIPKTTHLMTALINAGPTCYELAGAEDRSPMPPAAAMEMGAPREVVLGLAQQEADSRVEATTDNGVERPPVLVALSPTYGGGSADAAEFRRRAQARADGRLRRPPANQLARARKRDDRRRFREGRTPLYPDGEGQPLPYILMAKVGPYLPVAQRSA